VFPFLQVYTATTERRASTFLPTRQACEAGFAQSKGLPLPSTARCLEIVAG
jgi:hypothetical protein